MNNNTPMIIRETSSGYLLHTIQDDMLTHREIECVGAITPESAYSLTRQLRYLAQLDPKSEITIFLNSPGGEVDSGLAVYDVMKSLSCPIRTVCMGVAASMAAILFAAGTQRDIMPHGRVMIHDPMVSGNAGGSALQMEQVTRNLMKLREEACSILATCTGRDREEIARKTASDSWFTAQEAVDFGLADRIIHTI